MRLFSNVYQHILHDRQGEDSVCRDSLQLSLWQRRNHWRLSGDTRAVRHPHFIHFQQQGELSKSKGDLVLFIFHLFTIFGT